MSRTDVVDVAYLVAAVCFILALKGLSSPRTARRSTTAFGASSASTTRTTSSA